MKKSVKIALIALACVGVALAALAVLDFLVPERQDYNSAKQICTRFLDKHRGDMEQFAEKALNGQVNMPAKFLSATCYCDPDHGKVEFDIGSQGMLGGQYWTLVYTSDGTLYGETDSYEYYETDGNNIVRAERISGNWWYHWIDYDGTDLSSD